MCCYQMAQVGHGDGQRKKSKTVEMVATSTAHVRPDFQVWSMWVIKLTITIHICVCVCIHYIYILIP